jgi:hypothetical protein
MKKDAKKISGPLIVKKNPDLINLQEQDAKFRSAFVEAAKNSSPPPRERIVLPEALVVPGISFPQPAKAPVSKIPAKPVAKIPASKPAAKTGSKTSAKSGSKSVSKTPAKSGSKAGAKVGTLIIKKTEPAATESLTSREEGLKLEPEALTERITLQEKKDFEAKTEFSVQTEEIKQVGIDEGIQDGDFNQYLMQQGLLKEKKLVCENLLSEAVAVNPKVPLQIKLLKTLCFKRILKPVPDLFYCETIRTYYSPQSKPSSSIILSKITTLKYYLLQKPCVSAFFSEKSGYKMLKKPCPKIFYSEKEQKSYSSIYKPIDNLYYCDGKTDSYNHLHKPLINLYLYIPVSNWPISPALEVIEDYDLEKKTVKTIATRTASYDVLKKPQIDFEYNENRFTSKFPPIVPSFRSMNCIQIEQEDWKVRRGPAEIVIISTNEFKVVQKPKTDFWYQQKEYAEMCLQTEEDLEPSPEELPIETLSENNLLSFDEFISKLNSAPASKNPKENPLAFIDIAMNKINEIENLKKEVKLRENTKLKRAKAAVRIQAWMKGVWARRKHIPPIIELYKERLRQRKIKEVAKRIKVQWAPYAIFNALQTWHKIKNREKQRMYKMFLNFTATSIQKFWKGYQVRKFYRKKLLIKALAKKKLIRFVRYWKTRRILNIKRIRNNLKSIKETKLLLEDVRGDQKSVGLFKQLLSQLGSLHNKFRLDFRNLYSTGKWTGLPVHRESISIDVSTISNRPGKKQDDYSDTYYRDPPRRSSVKTEEQPRESLNKPNPPSYINKEEVPIRPLQLNYHEIYDDKLETLQSQPKFSNFLKKTQKNKPQEEKIFEKEIYEDQVPENLEESRQDEPKIDSKPKEFLKRKSKSVRAQKLEWKVTKRIDCWLPREKYPKVKEENPFEVRHIIPRENFMTLKEIEIEYINDLEINVKLSEYFDRDSSSIIPQLNPDSMFLKTYSEEMYQETIKELERHYNFLCSEEVLSG